MKTGKQHHLRHTRIYNIWTGIKSRCLNKNHKDYQLYGKRGIKVCDDWKNDIRAFYSWSIENGYKEDLTIDRIDPNGNYEPSNCRWVTMKEQQRNRRNNVLLSYNGETHCVSEWAEIRGLKVQTIFALLRNGTPVENILK